MFYTILWLIIWLLAGGSTLTFGSGGAFWALVVAVICDLTWFGYFRRQPYFR